VPVAVNCWLRPSDLELFVGEISSETSVAAVIVRSVLAATPEAGWIAEMLAVPIPTLVARPLVPAALLIVATDVAEEDHVTAVVRSCVVASV